jgi:DNA-binding protein Fis
MTEAFRKVLSDITTQKPLTLAELKGLYIEEVIRFAGGNKTKAARILGVNRRTVSRKAKGRTK